MWLTSGDLKLGTQARVLIDEIGDSGGELLVSAISVWEIAMLEAAGKVTLAESVDKWINRALQLSGVEISPLGISLHNCCNRRTGGALVIQGGAQSVAQEAR
jgi:PIN domain nuclease of toxin-antitoxin system